jgi:hypothetical protein
VFSSGRAIQIALDNETAVTELQEQLLLTRIVDISKYTNKGVDPTTLLVNTNDIECIDIRVVSDIATPNKKIIMDVNGNG